MSPSIRNPQSPPIRNSAIRVQPRHVRCQPTVELKGRVADWVAEIRRLRDEGETTLFVAATPGRAERTIELLKEYDIFAIPVERAEDARYAAVLVAIGSLSRGFRLPDAGLQIYAEADVFEEERRAPERRRAVSKAFLSDLRDLKIGDLVVHIDHGIGVFVGLKQIGVGDSGAGVPRAALRRRRQAVRAGRAARPRAEVHRRHAAAGRSAGRRVVGAREDARQEGDARHGRGAAQALRRAQGGARPRLQPRLALAAGIRGRLRVRPDRRPADGDRRHQARHGIVHADGPPALRRRRLRQDRSRDARRLQGGDGRQAGRLSRADHGARVPASEDAEGTLRRLPGPHRDGQPLPQQGRAERALVDLAAGKVDIIVGTHRLLSKDVEFRDPRAARRRRGAAVRRGAQGKDQADAERRWTCSR